MFHAQERGDLKVIGTMETDSQTTTNDPSFRDCLCGVLRSECWGERCLLHRLSQEVRVQDGQVATLAGGDSKIGVFAQAYPRNAVTCRSYAFTAFPYHCLWMPKNSIHLNP
jgi:hypothetical protein